MNDAMSHIDPSKVDIIRGSITLEEGAVVATNAVVTVSKKCRDVIIGKRSVVGALSFIDRSVPPNTVVHPNMDVFKMVVKHREEIPNEMPRL